MVENRLNSTVELSLGAINFTLLDFKHNKKPRVYQL